MDRGIGSGLLSFDIANIHAVESLFQSEGFFWLTTAVATSLAAEEMAKFFVNKTQMVDAAQTVQLFNLCIRSNDIRAEERERAKQWSMDTLKVIDEWNRQTPVFQDSYSLGISKGFTTYWLNYKLIELEWQQVLGLQEIEETYQFLNQVLADSEELDKIEQARQKQGMNEDQRVFLRSHWQYSKLFWTNLYTNLQLLSLGLSKMQQPT